MEMEDYIQKLRERKAVAASSAKDVAAQHNKGRLTSHERIALLFDPDSFNEIDTLVTPRYDVYMGGKASRCGDGVVTGVGLINGRRVFAAAQDASVMGGSLGEMHANKIVKAMRMALQYPRLRRLQRSDHHAARCPRLFARHQPGVWRDHPQWRASDLRL
jgi:propionyl-CoA carboxylase beta chain